MLPPSLNVTIPVGVGVPEVGVTVAVSVTLVPTATEVAEALSFVVVAVGMAALMVRLRLWVAVWLAESVTFTVKAEVVAVVGVPETKPVLAANESPAGRVPVLMLQV